ncbi:SDR family NAD(P)-dependent oxidoreductase [Jatrophihabitans sp. DSM 45814]
MELPNGAHGTRLAGKVAIVSGAGFDGEFLGTGAATAILFAAQGARVGLIDISADRAEHTLASIAEFGGEAVVAVADVSDAAGCVAAVGQTITHFGRLDILINNAAIAAGGSVVDIDPDVWNRVVDINLNGVMRMSRAAIPALRAAGGGSIVNLSSIAGTRGLGTSAYAAAKGGVIGLTADMAYSHGREGIRVNCIVPGHLHTPMGYGGDPEVREARRRSGMLGTEGNAWDVAWAAVFFASDESRWVTATQLPVDAGTTATTAFAMRKHLTDDL